MINNALRALLLIIVMHVGTGSVYGVDGLSGPAITTVAPTTGTVALSEADIARMNSEATAAGDSFKNQSLLSQATTFAKGAVRVVTNPLTALFSLMVPAGMMVYGFFKEAVASIRKTDYMGSSLAILVDPKAQWDTFLKAEGAVLKRLATGVKPAAGASTPTVQDLKAAGVETQLTNSLVGVNFDFGFVGAGDDLTQPLGFIRSATTGKYYYRPVRGQFKGPAVPVNGTKVAFDLRTRPFSVLVPQLMTSLTGPNVGGALWNSVMNYTQLDPIRIFTFKTLLLFSSALRNSISLSSQSAAQKKVDDSGQKYSSLTFKYTSGDKGAAYPGIANIQSELSKLLHRLRVTPDIKRTVEANNGETMPSKWDQSRIVYMGDVNPGLLLLSAMPTSLKQAFNAMFKADVNFYEYQAAIDRLHMTRPSEIQALYGQIRRLGDDSDDIATVKKSAAAGAYIDGYMMKLVAAKKMISEIDWRSGKHSFTDMMLLFFLMRRLLAEVYVGIEFIVSTFDAPSANITITSSANTKMGTSSAVGVAAEDGIYDNSVDASSYQDSSVDLTAHASVQGVIRNIDFDLLSNGVLANRFAALKDYASFVKSYADSFVANGIGGGVIDKRYARPATGAPAGGPDDLSTYFPPSSMKQTLGEFVSSVGKEAQATLQGIDASMASLGVSIEKARVAAADYVAAIATNGSASSGVIDQKVITMDDLVELLRSKQKWAQSYGLYPLGFEEKLLKIIELPGAVYLAYCVNYQMSLLSKPFEGDELYYYDDSFYDEDSSYLNLLATIMRAQLDLSRAGAVVSSIQGPVTFKNAKGVAYTVPSGSQFYLEGLQKYDQYFLLQEQNLRQALAMSGATSPEYKKALVAYANAGKLLSQKKKEMNAILRTFEFDRRKGARSGTVSPIGAASALASTGGAALSSMAHSATSGLVGTSSQGPSLQSASPGLASEEEVFDSGIVGTLEDGSVVYSYERSVNGFLQEELARFAFRARMLSLDTLKELVFMVTGIQAEDLWIGVEAKKRQMLEDQQEALAAAKPLVAEQDDLSLDQALALAGAAPLGDGAVIGEASKEEDVAISPVVEGSEDSGGVVDGAAVGTSVVVPSVSSLILTPVPDVHAPSSPEDSTPILLPDPGPQISVVASTPEVFLEQVQPVAPVAVVAAPSQGGLLVPSDLDAVVANALVLGQASYEDAEGQRVLSSMLNDVASGFSVAGVNNDGVGFTQALKKFVGVVARVQSPSTAVQTVLVDGLRQAMGSLAFDVGSPGISDVNSFDNMLEIVTYLQNGMLAEQGVALGAMAESLNGWLRSH